MNGIIQPIHVLISLLIMAGTIIGFLWRINRSFNRVIDIMIEYPPHRHVNGMVLFPKGYSPGEISTTDKAKSANAGV